MPGAASSENAPSPLRVFVSYAHKDLSLKEQFDVNLKILSLRGHISTWSDRHISGGEVWNQAIMDAMLEADIIIFMVSNAFLASDYIRLHEMPLAVEQARMEKATIVPIILKDCPWEEEEWAAHQALPIGVKPITEWPDIEKAFSEVEKAFRKVVQRLQLQKALEINAELKKQELAKKLELAKKQELEKSREDSPATTAADVPKSNGILRPSLGSIIQKQSSSLGSHCRAGYARVRAFGLRLIAWLTAASIQAFKFCHTHGQRCRVSLARRRSDIVQKFRYYRIETPQNEPPDSPDDQLPQAPPRNWRELFAENKKLLAVAAVLLVTLIILAYSPFFLFLWFCVLFLSSFFVPVIVAVRWSRSASITTSGGMFFAVFWRTAVCGVAFGALLSYLIAEMVHHQQSLLDTWVTIFVCYVVFWLLVSAIAGLAKAGEFGAIGDPVKEAAEMEEAPSLPPLRLSGKWKQLIALDVICFFLIVVANFDTHPFESGKDVWATLSVWGLYAIPVVLALAWSPLAFCQSRAGAFWSVFWRTALCGHVFLILHQVAISENPGTTFALSSFLESTYRLSRFYVALAFAGGLLRAFFFEAESLGTGHLAEQNLPKELGTADDENQIQLLSQTTETHSTPQDS